MTENRMENQVRASFRYYTIIKSHSDEYSRFMLYVDDVKIFKRYLRARRIISYYNTIFVILHIDVKLTLCH